MREDAYISFDNIGRFAMIPFSFIENSKHLSFHARWLFVALMYFRNTESGNAFPSYDTLRQLTGMRKEMISKAVKELEDNQQAWVWLERVKRFNKSTIYKLRLPKPINPLDEYEIPF